jgi:hypothetical protein
MPTTVVRYQAKPDRADENQELIEAVFADRCDVPPQATGATAVGRYS